MEILLSAELRLAYALLLQAAALVGSWRFVRRRVGTDATDRAADALLLNFLVQYAAVTLPGVLGILHPLTIGLVTLAASAGLYFAPTKAGVLEHARIEPAWEGWTVATCTLFVMGYLATVAYQQAFAPALAQDALTYHFPAAAQWLRTGRLGLFETWFFNPANTYSPLAGSAFIAWWIAPLGNDVLARHVPFPALALVFFAAIRLIRALGVRPAIATLIAAALVLSQPFIRQSIIEKDDLYLAAFFTCVAAGCGRERLRDALGAWRIGVALGLLLAMKYTAVFALPALILLVDAPWRAGWTVRRYAIVAGAVLLLAGPWYVRNALLTGNPLYPVDVKVFGVTVFKGLFESARSEAFSKPGEFLGLLTRRHQSLPPWPAGVVALAWVAAMIKRFRGIPRDPLLRACLLGPALAMAVFWWRAPYAEIRFVFPAFVLLYASAAVAIAAWASQWELCLGPVAVLLIFWRTAPYADIQVSLPMFVVLSAAAVMAIAGSVTRRHLAVQLITAIVFSCRRGRRAFGSARSRPTWACRGTSRRAPRRGRPNRSAAAVVIDRARGRPAEDGRTAGARPMGPAGRPALPGRRGVRRDGRLRVRLLVGVRRAVPGVLGPPGPGLRARRPRRGVVLGLRQAPAGRAAGVHEHVPGSPAERVHARAAAGLRADAAGRVAHSRPPAPAGAPVGRATRAGVRRGDGGADRRGRVAGQAQGERGDAPVPGQARPAGESAGGRDRPRAPRAVRVGVR